MSIRVRSWFSLVIPSSAFICVYPWLKLRFRGCFPRSAIFRDGYFGKCLVLVGAEVALPLPLTLTDFCSLRSHALPHPAFPEIRFPRRRRRTGRDHRRGGTRETDRRV